ncbi:MAG: serine/threonine-protein kinase [Cyanobacteria bacterium J06643_4]
MLISNRYQVLEILGEGGFGKAYLAEDTHMPSKRQCVVKELKPINSSPAIYQLIQERFQREAAILEKLGAKHPQIPCLYAYFSEGGKFYLVQEWINGKTLKALSAQHSPASEATVRALLTSLLPVLHFIHTQGIIHRDIKPENIILRTDTWQPVLIDFGAVREVMGTVVDGITPISSVVIGTPGYMSLEQAAGRPVPSSDLYSLALTIIFLLTGKSPQSIPLTQETGEFEWQPATGEVSTELTKILTRAVKSYPKDRYDSALEMLSDLSPEIAPNTATQTTATQTADTSEQSAYTATQASPTASPTAKRDETVATAPPYQSTQTIHAQSEAKAEKSRVVLAAEFAFFGIIVCLLIFSLFALTGT